MHGCFWERSPHIQKVRVAVGVSLAFQPERKVATAFEPTVPLHLSGSYQDVLAAIAVGTPSHNGVVAQVSALMCFIVQRSTSCQFDRATPLSFPVDVASLAKGIFVA